MPDKSTSFLHLESQAHGGAFGHNRIPTPTDAQCKAGNYKLGRITLHGLSIAIEQPRGTYRTGIGADGKRWTSRMAAHYGYFSGTRGNDGDGVDCFVGFYHQSEMAYVINQNVDSRFDEHKCLIGFPDEESARRAYTDSYDRGWPGLASIVPASISQLKWWLKNGDMTRPLKPEHLPHEGREPMNRRMQWSADALPYDQTLDQVLYDIRRMDAGEDLMLDSVTMADILADSDGVLAFDALVVPFSSLERRMGVMQRVMERNAQTVKPVARQITEPFTQRGVANVAVLFELSDGQTVSIYFHNPDVTPKKMAGTDELISWKWLLNKKDLTIVVAPERGVDLDINEVARRIMKLAEKNSAAFTRANGKRAETMQRLTSLSDEIAVLEIELSSAQRALEVAQVGVEDRAARATVMVPALPDGNSPVIAEPEVTLPIASVSADGSVYYPFAAREFITRFMGSKETAALVIVSSSDGATKREKLLNTDNKQAVTRATNELWREVADINDSGVESQVIRAAQLSPLNAAALLRERGVTVSLDMPASLLPIRVGALYDVAMTDINGRPETTARYWEGCMFSGVSDTGNSKAMAVELTADFKHEKSSTITRVPLDQLGAWLKSGLLRPAQFGAGYQSPEDQADLQRRTETLVNRISKIDDVSVSLLAAKMGLSNADKKSRNNHLDAIFANHPDDIEVALAGLKVQELDPTAVPLPAMDPMANARARIASEQFKTLTRDLLGSTATIASIDSGTAPGYDRSLFVNSITGKIKRLEDKDPLLTSLLLAWLSVTQKKLTKPAITERNSAWSLAGGEWEQYVSLFELVAPAAPVQPAEADPGAELSTTETEQGVPQAQKDELIAQIGAEAQPGVQVGPSSIDPLQAGLTPEGRESKVKTAKGTEVVTGFAVVEADRLITSHDPATGDVNPEFPQDLQPRDRARETSRAWVLKTAANLDPEQLGKTRRADTGAPIVGPDRVVESGNGRTMAIIEAYRIGKADEYRAWLESEADYFGLSAEKVKSMKRPVLVRIRTSNVNRAEFAVEANQDDKLAMTATEKARADANRLTDDMIALMTDNGDLNAAANTAFLSSFLRSLGDAEAAQYSTSEGKPTSSLIARVQAAIFAKAYNDDRLLELTADSAKPEIANIISALNFAAPEFIQSAALDPVAAGGATQKLADSIEASLNTQAVAAIIGATNVIKQAKESGMQVDEFIKQQGLFGDLDPSVAAMAVFIAKNNRSAKRMGAAFKAMATFVKGEIERRQTTDMFGEPVPIGFPEIIAAANRELDRMFGEGAFAIEAVDLFARPAEPESSPAAAPVIPLTRPAHEVTLVEFSKAATATKLENHGRKWDVSYVVNGQKMSGFSDADTAEGAIRDEHHALVNNAIYANSPDATDSMNGTSMPPAEVLAEYPDLAKLADEISVAPAPVPTPTEDPQMTPDKALFQSVIDGTVTTPDGEGMLSSALADTLEAAYMRHAGNPEMDDLFEKAINAYTEAEVAASAAL